ncbi:MAG: leucine-rich repeat domain-containing protein [Clostridia bacterium]|nr:leucine-rich repeat domain-containing protein [Clostridia bacterium]
MKKKWLLGLLCGFAACLALGFAACNFGKTGEVVAGEDTFVMGSDGIIVKYYQRDHYPNGAKGELPTKIVIPKEIGGVKVTGIAEDVFNGYGKIKTVVIPDGVTIEKEAFYGCDNLTSVTIGNNATIGESAFASCESLTDVTIGTDAHIMAGAFERADCFTYSDCGNVRYIGAYLISAQKTLAGAFEIRNGTLGIAAEAFAECVNLESVKLPDCVKRIEPSAFRGCTGLQGVYITDKKAWCKISFGNEDANPLRCAKNLYINDVLTEHLVIPSSVNSIEDFAFIDCSLKSVVFADSVTSIGASAFAHCVNLTSVTLPNGLTRIENSVFLSCESLTGITIPDSVTSIGENAFAHCKSLTSINIPSNVTRIENSAFFYCESLTSITIPNSVTSIERSAFEGAGLTSITVPNSVTEIGDRIFAECKNLTSATLPSGLTVIADYMFSGCLELENVDIPYSVTEIGSNAFRCCYKLKNVTLSENVRYIRASAFDRCGLLSVILPDNVSIVEGYGFYNCASLFYIVLPRNRILFGDEVFEFCGMLTNVYYTGTASDWAELGDDYTSVFSGKTVYYYVQNEGNVPTNGGNYWHYVDGEPTAW